MTPGTSPSIHQHDLHGLDFLRLAASAGVVFYHYASYLPSSIGWAGEDQLVPFRLWVDLFFVVSGFVIAYVYAPSVGRDFDYRGFMQKRIARLMPLHAVTLAFYAAIGLLMFVGIRPDSAERFDWACLVPNLLLVHAWGTCQAVSFNTPSWSISAEMAMYLAFPLFAMLMGKGRGLSLLAIAVVAIVLLEWWSRMPGQQYWLFRASQFGVVRAFPSFLLGMVLYANRDLLARLPGAQLVGVGGLIAFVALCFLPVPYLALLLTVYLAVAGFIAMDVQGRTGPVLAYVGKGGILTYSIYLLHLPVATVMMTLAKRFLKLEGAALVGWIGVTTVVMLLVSWLCYTYFEMPARRWVNGLGRRSRATAGGKVTAA